MTVEAALVLPTLVLVLIMCLAGIGCVTAQLRCADAAQEAARLAGRGDLDAAYAAAASLAPAGATVTIGQDGDLVRVEVIARPVGGLLPGITVRAAAVAVREESVGEDP